jgi:chitinase
MKSIKIIALIAIGSLVISCKSQTRADNDPAKNEKVVIAYVTSWSTVIPDPAYLTHINYAFGHVSNTFEGVRIDNEDRLKQMVELKKQKPSLKVLLSIGGWGSGRFSEMAADENYRRSFAKDCKRVVDAFELDGIDIDWEYPTADMAGISASPADTENFTRMMRDIRQEIGDNKLLTLATSASAKYIDFRGINSYINFVNIMSYDMGNPPYHHSGLYRSEHTGDISVDEAVKAHIDAGIPAQKLVMGIPFYGRGRKEVGNFGDYKKLITSTILNGNGTTRPKLHIWQVIPSNLYAAMMIRVPLLSNANISSTRTCPEPCIGSMTGTTARVHCAKRFSMD